jgi:hypothetical protein
LIASLPNLEEKKNRIIDFFSSERESNQLFVIGRKKYVRENFLIRRKSLNFFSDSSKKTDIDCLVDDVDE